MKKLLALLVTALVSWQLANAQLVLQSFPYGNGLDLPMDVATDALDNVFVAGKFYPDTFSVSPVLSVLTKQGREGNLLWSANVVSPADVTAERVCVDAAGNSYIAGSFLTTSGQPFHLAGGPVISSGGNLSIFFAKYNFNGSVQWVKTFGGSGFATISGLSCDNSGNIYLSASTHANQVTFGNNITFQSPAPGEESFVVKYNSAGDAVWVTQVAGKVNDLAVTGLGEVCIAGKFPAGSTIGPLTIGSTTYSGSTSGLFAAKLDVSGAPLWAQTSAAPAQDNSSRGMAVATDAAGAVYLAAIYYTNITFGGQSLVPSSNPTSGLIIKLNSSGQTEWVKNIAGNTPVMTPRVSLEVDATGNIHVAGNFGNPVTISGQVINYTFPSQVIPADAIVLCKLDPSGNYIWHIGGGIDFYTMYKECPSGIAFDSQNNCYLAGILDEFGSMGSWGEMHFGNTNNYTYGGFLYKIKSGNHANRLSGNIFCDLNLNGIKDATDYAIPGILAESQPLGFLSVSGQGGNFHSYVDTGMFTLSLPYAPPAYTVVPAVHTGYFASSGNSDTTLHFALQPIPGQQDLRVTLTATTFPRPGFFYPLNLTYRNTGTTTMSGSVELQLDSLLNFQNSTPVQNSQTGNTLSWSFANLAPLQSATILVNTQVPATAILGSTIHQLATVFPLSGDLTPADNTDTDSAIVVGSYDPNDKQVNHTSLTPTQVQNEEWLEYTIRFQNTGTDTAFTVRLADTLSAMLNIPTIEVLASSHPNTWSIKGAGIMEFRFDNILLPDSNTNEAASHGFVKYRIRPKTTLALGDVIENTAYIYFDFNAPIVTNTATTEVSFVNAVTTLERNPLHVYPNPNKGTFTLQCSNISSSQVLAELRNVLGQTVWQQNLPTENGKLQQVINTGNLSKGVYYMQVKTDKGSKVQKVVID